MPRTYKRKLGTYQYGNYNKSNIARAIADVRSRKKTLRGAAEYYGIPASTLCNKIKEKHSSTPGGQTALSKEEESMLITGIKKASEWGFPFTRHDIRSLVKQYLDRKGKTIRRFKNNFPGVEWFFHFMKRHKTLTERLSQNIKRCRAELSHQVISEYFDSLSESLEDVPPCNIINYDETNLSDDPGRAKVICKRGIKRVDRIIDSSKSSTSIMMAASGSGILLPLYVVYKSVHLYPTWTENGPARTIYNRSKSGWFDGPIFENWFQEVALPYFKNCEGKKALIGDNLSSHISMHVIEECEKHNIDFILLPPNATHLLQPMDVSFFAPFKKSWRKILAKWKIKNRGVIPKSEFPGLLREALEEIGARSVTNILSGFKACGIVPLDRNIVLDKLPKELEDADNRLQLDKHWSTTFIDFLQASRIIDSPVMKKRGKKLNVPPGKGITSADLNTTAQGTNPTTSSVSNKTSDCQKRSRHPSTSTSSDDMEEISSESEVEESEDHDSESQNETLCDNLPEEDLSTNDYVIVKFKCPKNNLKYYIGQISEIVDKDLFLVNFMRNKKTTMFKIENYFYFPTIKDESLVNFPDIILKLKSPKDLRRNRFVFQNLPDLTTE